MKATTLALKEVEQWVESRRELAVAQELRELAVAQEQLQNIKQVLAEIDGE